MAVKTNPKNYEHYLINCSTPLDNYLTFGMMAIASAVALRRTELQGFHLLFYFALAQIILSFLGFIAMVLLSHHVSIQAAQNVLNGRLLLSCPVFALGLAGAFFLLRTRSAAS